MSKQEGNEYVMSALACNDPETARELFAIAWRITDLERKNAQLECLIYDAKDISAEAKIEIAEEPESWEDEFETEEVRFIRKKLRAHSNSEFHELLAKGVEQVKSGAKRNRALREGIDQFRWFAIAEDDAQWKEWSDCVRQTIKQQRECRCGCGCHYCPLCESFLNRALPGRDNQVN